MSLVVDPDAVPAVPSVDVAPESQPSPGATAICSTSTGCRAGDLDLVMRTTDAMREVLGSAHRQGPGAARHAR